MESMLTFCAWALLRYSVPKVVENLRCECGVLSRVFVCTKTCKKRRLRDSASEISKKMKKLKFLVVLCSVACCTSCLRTTYYIGSSRPDDRQVKVGQELFHHHYLAGLIAGSNATVETGEYTNNTENFAVRTSTNFVDALIGSVTMGIYTPTKTTWFLSIDEINKQSNSQKQ